VQQLLAGGDGVAAVLLSVSLKPDPFQPSRGERYGVGWDCLSGVNLNPTSVRGTGVPQALSALIPDDGGPIRCSVTGPRSLSRRNGRR